MAREPLWPFLDFEGVTGEALVEAYRKVYLDTYVFAEDGRRREFRDWTGALVNFPRHQFEHAFTETPGYREGLFHERFSLKRARRMLWIKEVLAGSKGTIKRYQQLRKDSRGRDAKRRTFLVCEENYFVVLDDPRKEEQPFQFVSAFTAHDLDYLRRNQAGSVLLETRKREG